MKREFLISVATLATAAGVAVAFSGAAAAPSSALTHRIQLGANSDVQTIAVAAQDKRVAKKKRAPAAPPCQQVAGVWSYLNGDTLSDQTGPPPNRTPGLPVLRRAAASASPSNGVTASPTR